MNQADLLEPDATGPTCETCAAWSGEECRVNPPVALAIGSQVVTVFPRTKGTAWCLAHVAADDSESDMQFPPIEGDAQ
jgi:hypothetical protein